MKNQKSINNSVTLRDFTKIAFKYYLTEPTLHYVTMITLWNIRNLFLSFLLPLLIFSMNKAKDS